MPIVTCNELGLAPVQELIHRFDVELVAVPLHQLIPGTFWGEPEAGLVGNQLFVRGDTPIHSALHEACHFICMDAARRAALHTDAGGDTAEENAVCYLQVLLADTLPGYGRGRVFADMDAWGYSFRLGSARSWFESDADEARRWLLEHGLIDHGGHVTWKVRS